MYFGKIYFQNIINFLNSKILNTYEEQKNIQFYIVPLT